MVTCLPCMVLVTNYRGCTVSKMNLCIILQPNTTSPSQESNAKFVLHNAILL